MKIWNIKTKKNDNKAGKSSKEDDLLCTLLKSRGLAENEFEEFLNPLNCALSSPYIFSDMKKAVERIKTAISNKELILIWGDFDADGVTSTAILYKTLRALGANFDYIIPDREKMGHGINSKFILPYIAKKKPKVMITVDCGISNNKEVSLLKNFGVDVILTDHHKAPDILPEAFAIINPKAPNSLDEKLSIAEIKNVSELAGAGVAYKLASALLETPNALQNKEIEDLKNEILILSCVGTIADVVPLLHENRVIAAKGLELINKGCHKGIELLFKANSRQEGEISSYDAAFILAPRINAAGRLKTAEPAFRLLTETDENILNAALKELDSFNKIRQNLCDKIFDEALDEISKNKNFKKEKAIILFREDWHIGVIGIVASKLVEKFYKPVFLITKDDDNMARCSIRSIKEYNVAEILDENAELFEGCGGHSLAGGFSFDLNKRKFEEVKTAILNTLNLKEDVKIKGPVLDIDMKLEAKDITEGLIETIKKLEPTGQDNPAPVFSINDITLISKKTMGKENNHISFRGEKDGCDFNCIRWRHSTIPVMEGESFDIAFEPKLNVFNGETSVRLYIQDIKSENMSKSTETDIKFYDHRMKKGILAQIEEYVKRPNVDIDIFARKIKTKTLLKEYEEISAKICEDNLFEAEDLMFFDYPASLDEFIEILKEKQTGKIHLMAEEFDNNIENYIKQLIGMLKYATNNKNGAVSIPNIASMIGMNENFIQGVLEILEELNSIEILDIDKIKFITPPHMDDFYNHLSYETLRSEFDRLLDIKKYIAQATLDDIKKLIAE